MIRFNTKCKITAVAAKPKAGGLAYSGGFMKVPGYGTVIVRLSGVTSAATVPLLKDHANELDSVVGVATPTITEKEIRFVATIAKTPSGEHFKALLESVGETQASVGLDPVKTVFAKAGERITENGQTLVVPTGGVTIVVASILKEISIVPLGADATTSVKIAAKRRKEILMQNESDNFKVPAEQELDDAARISASARNWMRDRPDQVEDIQAAAATAIEENQTLNQFELKMIRTMRADPRIGAPRRRQEPIATSDVLSANLCLRSAMPTKSVEAAFGAGIVERAADLKITNLVDLCRAALTAEHLTIPNTRGEMIRAAFSTLSLPQALGDSARKLALDAYRNTPATWREFCKIVPVQDFKVMKLLRATMGEGFEELGGGGEIKHTTMSEEGASLRARTYARGLGITRQDIINDDLGVLENPARDLGRLGVRIISDQVYRLLLLNKEYDGVTSFFTTVRGNLIEGVGTALTLDTLTSTLASVIARVDRKGNNIDIMPRSLMVPPELWAAATRLINSTLIARDTSSTDDLPQGNPVLNMLKPIVEPRLSNAALSGSSTKAWYLMPAPQDGGITIGFLDGHEGPTIEQVDAGHNVLGVFFRGYIDFGVSLSDFRACTKIKGEA